MEYSMIVDGMQVEVSPDGEIWTMPEDRFPWRERKMRSVELAKLYRKAGFTDYSLRVLTCATSMTFGVVNGERKLQAVNFCHLRLCPMCISRRARRAAYKLSKVLDMVEGEHKAKFIFLTLTMRNVVDGSKLGEALEELTAAWNRFLKQRQLERSVKGWYRAIEITRGDNRWHENRKTGRKFYREDKGYHPHIHAILAVDQDYFSRESRQSGKYLNQSDLIERWQKALRVDYMPSVRIQTTKAHGEKSACLAAAAEAAKYAVKDEEYIDQSLPEKRLVEILTDYTNALHRRRLTAFGGWMKDAARKLDAEDLDDGDLVHADEDAIREDIAELIEVYNWHFGVGDYILAKREINPFLVRRKEIGAEERKFCNEPGSI